MDKASSIEIQRMNAWWIADTDRYSDLYFIFFVCSKRDSQTERRLTNCKQNWTIQCWEKEAAIGHPLQTLHCGVCISRFQVYRRQNWWTLIDIEMMHPKDANGILSIKLHCQEQELKYQHKLCRRL